MTINSKIPTETSQGVVLQPSHQLPLVIIALGLIFLPLPIYPWPSLLISGFGLFLLVQSFILRVEFTPNDLVIWQFGRELRRFPFKSWLAWRLLLPALPGVLYFREEASPHLLPILFDPITLEKQLKLRVGSLQTPKKDLIKPS